MGGGFTGPGPVGGAFTGGGITGPGPVGGAFTGPVPEGGSTGPGPVGGAFTGPVPEGGVPVGGVPGFGIPGRQPISCCSGAICETAVEAPEWYPNIAVTSWAHISAYSDSFCAIAGKFSPNRFVLARALVTARFAAISAGGTVAERAASNADATAVAWVAACSEWQAAVPSQAAYGAAASVIAFADGPCHAEPARPEVTDPNEHAAARNSLAKPVQAVAAACIGSDPAPACMSAELTSGGKQG